ncbi:unnamed protein product, partial [Ectocarpus fasciculatus]
WFLWVAAFCVLVAICGLCSCYVVTPVVRSCRERFGVKHGWKPKGVVVRQEQHQRHEKHQQQQHQLQQQQQQPDRGRPRGTGERERGDARDSKSHHQRYHHWYLDDLLKITPEDEVEFGVRHSPAYTATPTPRVARTASGLAPQSRRHQYRPQHRPQEKRRASFPMSSMSSSGESCSRSVLSAPARRKSSDYYYDDYHAHNRRRSVSSGTRREVTVVDEPGIGAEATLRGGGWMGAANGRL